MQIAALTLVAASLLTASAASAATTQLTDLDYLKASRCSGIATGLNGPQAASLNSLVKAESRHRDDLVLSRAQSEFDRAKRQARAGDNKDRLNAELAGACVAYTGEAQNMAATSAAKDASTR